MKLSDLSVANPEGIMRILQKVIEEEKDITRNLLDLQEKQSNRVQNTYTKESLREIWYSAKI